MCMKETFFDANIQEVLKKLNTTEKGISSREASELLKKYGKNVLPQKKKDTILKVFLSQLNNPITFVLIIAVFLSFLIKENVDAMFIIIVIALDSILGTVQE
ncbi:ATPase, partial [bacterium]|nr:ATPase [bacterium]